MPQSFMSLPHDDMKKKLCQILKIQLNLKNSILETIQTSCEHFNCIYYFTTLFI